MAYLIRVEINDGVTKGLNLKEESPFPNRKIGLNVLTKNIMLIEMDRK